MKKHIIKIICLSILLFSLSGCNQSPQSINQQGQKVDEIAINTNINYEMLLPTIASPIRGISVNTNAYLTLDKMESDLLAIAPQYISTNNYYQPGEILTSKDASLLLSPHLDQHQMENVLKNDPQAQNIGLNSNDFNFVTTLIEQDFYTSNKKGKKINHVAIGVGLNCDNPQKPFNINDFLEYDGKIIANQIAKVIRSKEQYKEIPIMFAFYKQSNNPILPGVYIANGNMSAKDQNLVNINKLDNEYIPFLDSLGENKNPELNNKIQNMKNELKNYFGNTLNVNGIGYYQKNKLKQLNLEIIFPITSIIDGNVIINYIEQYLHKNLSLNANIYIDVRSSGGNTIASLTKENNKINKIVNKE